MEVRRLCSNMAGFRWSRVPRVWQVDSMVLVGGLRAASHHTGDMLVELCRCGCCCFLSGRAHQSLLPLGQPAEGRKQPTNQGYTDRNVKYVVVPQKNVHVNVLQKMFSQKVCSSAEEEKHSLFFLFIRRKILKQRFVVLWQVL